MKRTLLILCAGLLLVGAAVAQQKSDKLFRTMNLGPKAVLVGCKDGQKPQLKVLESFGVVSCPDPKGVRYEGTIPRPNPNQDASTAQ